MLKLEVRHVQDLSEEVLNSRSPLRSRGCAEDGPRVLTSQVPLAFGHPKEYGWVGEKP